MGHQETRHRVGRDVALVSRTGEGDGILVSADRNPNTRGALVVGLIGSAGGPPALPKDAGQRPALPVVTSGLDPLAAQIDAGKVKVVISIGEDLTAAGLSAAHLAKVTVIYLGTHANATSAAAKVVLPTLTVFEKSGTFVNQQFRIQKFLKAVPAPAGTTDDLVVLAKLAKLPAGEIAAVWKLIAAEVPALVALTFASLPDTGLFLDPTPWAALPFVEGETLHYKPAPASALNA